jgi:hypothetical protein
MKPKVGIVSLLVTLGLPVSPVALLAHRGSAI